MAWKFWKRWRARLMQRRSMGWMLRRADDKWLDDIGLTRHDLRTLLDDWDDNGDQRRPDKTP